MTKNKRKKEEKRSGIKGKKEEIKDIKVPPYLNYVAVAILLAIFTLSLYLRTVMPYDSVFRGNIVAFASDDAVYHMRLVENTLFNFPHRLTYDPLTQYPVGSLTHFGPLWTQLISTISLIVGMGSYNMQTVNTIGAFFPGIVGALVVFPVYSIGKNLGNRATGLLAAFMITVLPGQFFSRSILGFTDHHVAEVFFSTATLAFFILALKSGRERKISFSEVHLKDKAVLFSIFAGIMLLAFQLSWAGAPFFAMIILIFILIQYIIDDMRDIPTDYLAIATIPMFFINFIGVLPYVNTEHGFATSYYSLLHIAASLSGIGFPIALSIISSEVKKRDYKSYYFILSLGGFFILGMLGMWLILPDMYHAIVGAPGLIFAFPTGGQATVAEDTAILERPGSVWSYFPIFSSLDRIFPAATLDKFVFWFIVGVLAAFAYRIVRKQRAEDVLFLVWSSVMFLAMYGQNRWSYYFAVNVALIVGYVGIALCERSFKYGGLQWQVNKENPGNIGFEKVVSLTLIAMLVLFFTFTSVATTVIGSEERPPISRWGGGEPSGGGFAEWLETLEWMRFNTPDPGLDYLAVYEKKTFQYPESAYGVMSWWDYGHIITYWAHRIPNANPFQAGIGGGSSHSPGASTFLISESEEEADSVLDDLGLNGKPGARYIVTNGYMAYSIQGVFATWDYDPAIHDPILYGQNVRPEPTKYFESVVFTNEGGTRIPGLRSFTSMAGKLHILDGNGLKRYRLVHESPQNPNTVGGYQEQWFKNIYNRLYGGNVALEFSGVVKVFEHVKGAKITGSAPPGATVTLTNTVNTNIGRTIPYTQTTSSDGTYTFTVPYSTLGPIPGETQFDTKPTGPYTVTAGNVSIQVDVREKDILEGGTITLDLI